MPKQKGVFKLRGKMDDFSFYQSKDGYIVRMRGGVDGERIKKDPAFARTRENGNEFGRAAVYGKLLRTALRSVVSKVKDGRATGRLHRQMVKVIQSDMINARGLRSLSNGDISLLKGFDFNENGKLGSTVYFPFSVTMDRAAGEVKISIPDFIAEGEVMSPSGASHLRLVGGVAEIEPSGLTSKSGSEASSWIPIDAATTPALDLNMTITANTTDQLYVVFGVEFGQEVNSDIYLLRNGAFNALQIVDTNKL